MKISQPIRSLGMLAAIAGGVLLAAGWLWALAIGGPASRGPIWVLGIAHLLIPFGVLILYAYQAKEIGTLGVVGLVLANVGNPLLVGLLLVGADAIGLSLPVNFVAPLGLSAYMVGFLMLSLLTGWAARRAGWKLPVWAVLLWAAGSVMVPVGVVLYDPFPAVTVVGSLAVAAGLAGVVVSLWPGVTQEMSPGQPAQ